MYTRSHLPAKHYDADTTEPISCGLHTLEELLSWSQSDARSFNVATVPLSSRKPTLKRSPQRTLVSHDMMGGYLDDRFIQGTSAENPYAFYHWQYIDIFNYFAHNLVTIPPAVWTNAAHKNGVIVLGTFITEWDDGATICETFLRDEESYRSAADKLVDISRYYGFDGWLVNIENVLSEVAVKNMPPFLRYLTDQMHARVPDSQILWYDSVIENGKLLWQNQLNQSNSMFFDACDGFFTNYNWTEESLESMSDVRSAEGRHADIYVGVDVFARGKVVGGMLETNEALKVIRRHNFSAAIFAPGWVYETLEDKAEFCRHQDRFWSLLSPHLHIHQPVLLLPFFSSFCRGFGKDFYWRGQCEERRRWFHLTAQEVQPLYYESDLGEGSWLRSRGCLEEAWSGGGSLVLDGLFPAAGTEPLRAKIFSLNVVLPTRMLVVLVCKPSAGVEASLELRTADAGQLAHTDIPDDELSSVIPDILEEGHPLVSHLCGSSEPGGWTLRCSQLELGGSVLRQLCLNIRRDEGNEDAHFSCRLGEIMLLNAASLQVAPQQIEDLCIRDVHWLRGAGPSPDSTSPFLRLNATLSWGYRGTAHHFRVHWRRLRGPDPRIPPGPLALVGRAYPRQYRVTELQVPEPPGLLELVVEPVIREAPPVPESYWGRRSLSYAEGQAAQ